MQFKIVGKSSCIINITYCVWIITVLYKIDLNYDKRFTKLVIHVK